MTTQSSTKPIALFPDLPREAPLVDKDSGKMHDEWLFFFDHLIMALQTNFKTEGFVIPPETAANIANLLAAASDNNIIYDSTNNLFNGNIDNTSIPGQVWLPFAMIVTFAGNPNGFVAGFVSELCLDTTNKILYVCTVAGNAASAQWTST